MRLSYSTDVISTFGVHKYEGTYEPRGHKYIVDISYEKAFTVTYQVGGVLLKKEILMMHNAPQVLVRYTLLELTQLLSCA